MNLPPFFSASWTDTGLSCSAWTPGLAPAMARDSLPGCQRLNPGYRELHSSEGTDTLPSSTSTPELLLFSGEKVNWKDEGEDEAFQTLPAEVSLSRGEFEEITWGVKSRKRRTRLGGCLVLVHAARSRAYNSSFLLQALIRICLFLRDPLISHLSPQSESFLPSSHLVDPSLLPSLAPLATFSASSLPCCDSSSRLLLLSSLHVFCGK